MPYKRTGGEGRKRGEKRYTLHTAILSEVVFLDRNLLGGARQAEQVVPMTSSAKGKFFPISSI